MEGKFEGLKRKANAVVGRQIFQEKHQTKTMAWLEEGGGAKEVSTQLAEAIQNVQETLGRDDSTVVWLTTKSLESVTVPKDVSAASYFDLKRGAEESRMAAEVGLLKEQIFGESGIHGQRFFIEPTESYTVLKGVTSGLADAIGKSRQGTDVLYQENRQEMGCDRDKVYDPENLPKWRMLIANHKTSGGESFKDWRLNYDPVNQKIGIRPEATMVPGILFDVRVVKYGKEAERNFKEIIDKKLVGRVMLFQNEKGLVDKVEVWTPHFTCDEVETRDIVEKIGGFLKPDNERESHETNILRSYVIQDEAEGAVTVFDAETSFRFGDNESALVEEAKDFVDMNQSAFILSALMASEDRKTGYVCVGPSKSSGLQFGLLPVSPRFEKFRQFLKGDLDFKKPYEITGLLQSEYPLNETRAFFVGLRKAAKYVRNEVALAKAGHSTINTLGAYLTDFSRNFFKVAFQKQNHLVAEGSDQVSSVSHLNNKNVKNAVFITALNITSDNVLALKRDEKGLVCDLRMRTDRSFQNDLIEEMSRGSVDLTALNPAVINEHAKKVIENRKKNFRKAVVLMSLLVLREKYAGDIEKTHEINEKFYKAAAEIEK